MGYFYYYPEYCCNNELVGIIILVVFFDVVFSRESEYPLLQDVVLFLGYVVVTRNLPSIPQSAS
jgi:hypothetical protein